MTLYLIDEVLAVQAREARDRYRQFSQQRKTKYHCPLGLDLTRSTIPN